MTTQSPWQSEYQRAFGSISPPKVKIIKQDPKAAIVPDSLQEQDEDIHNNTTTDGSTNLSASGGENRRGNDDDDDDDDNDANSAFTSNSSSPRISSIRIFLVVAGADEIAGSRSLAT